MSQAVYNVNQLMAENFRFVESDLRVLAADAEEITSRERIVKGLIIAVLSILLFGALYFAKTPKMRNQVDSKDGVCRRNMLFHPNV